MDKRIAGRQAASRYLEALPAAGIPEQKTVGREKIFLHPRLLGLLTHERNDVAPFRQRRRC